MAIKVHQDIEPLPIKVFGDIEADKKYKKVKKLSKQGGDDQYFFTGEYDLTAYLEDVDDETLANCKNLCLCQRFKRGAPIQDLILVIGEKVNQATGRILTEIEASSTNLADEQNITFNWDVPEGFKMLAYSVGLHGNLNRLLCQR